MFRLSAPACLTFALLAVGSASSADAALLSLGATALSSDGSEVGGGPITTETVVAWNVNDLEEFDADPIDDGVATPPTFDVNGVTFQNDQPSSISFTRDGDNPGGTDTFTNNDAAYDNGSGIEMLMRSVIVSDDADSGEPRNIFLTFSDLVIGQRYRVQLTHQQDIGNAPARRMQVYFGDASSSDTTGFFDVGDDVGYITTADFIADDTTQLFTLASIGGEAERSSLNGAALFTVPEPASLALVGLGGACLLGRSRRA